jgi:PilZ domain
MAVTDRRKAYRLSIRMKLRIEGTNALGQPFVEDTETLNVSVEGTGFYTRLELSVGQAVVISVPEKCRINGRVAWMGKKNAEGFQEVGVQLLPPLTGWVIK